MSSRDEHYVLDICDKVLRREGKRQKRFAFLLGDPGKNGRCVRLPVDIYYEDLLLVIEYREVQHIVSIQIMDRRQTCSGVDRGQQRKIYDQRRRIVLPQHGIRIVELDYHQFEHDSRGRLKRHLVEDEAVIHHCLSEYLSS